MFTFFSMHFVIFSGRGRPIANVGTRDYKEAMVLQSIHKDDKSKLPHICILFTHDVKYFYFFSLHMKLCFSAKRFHCPVCEQQFTRKERCKHHVNSVHFGKKFACRNCNDLFDTENAMIRHRHRCEGTTPENFVCDLPSVDSDKSKKGKKKPCAAAFESSEKLFIHKASVHWDIKCWYCPRESCSGSFYAKKDYLTHVGTENRPGKCHFARGPGQTQLKRYLCLACGRRFDTLRAFRYHAALFCKSQNNDKDPAYQDTRPNDPPGS